jgi:radical SAM superfamily enzyme YgiQ (UPF0313 family)
MRIALVPALKPDNPADRVYPPLGLGYLASFLRKHEPSLSIAVFTSPNDAAAFEPHLVGISSTTEHFTRAQAAARVLRAKTKALIVAGGVHITALPESLPEELDGAVLGEGEETLLDIVRSEGDLSKVSGLALRKGGKIELTPRRRPSVSLESIPFPDREALAPSFPPGPEMHVMSSRGCPHRCAFCSACRHWRGFRAFPAPYTVREVEMILERYSPNSLRFFDDLFLADKKRLAELHHLIVERGIHRKVSLSGYVRAGDFDEDACRLLKEMNFLSVSFGAESASQRILTKLKGSGARTQDNERLLDLCGRYRIAPSASFIIGTPGETEADLRATREFILRNAERFMDIQVFPLVPYPGAAFWNLAVRRGILSPREEDWGRLAILLEDFDPSTFPYLNEAMPYERFCSWVGEFREICRSIRPFPDRIARLTE